MGEETGLCFAGCVFLTFRGPLASHDSNPYPNRSRIARYNATKLVIFCPFVGPQFSMGNVANFAGRDLSLRPRAQYTFGSSSVRWAGALASNETEQSPGVIHGGNMRATTSTHLFNLLVLRHRCLLQRPETSRLPKVVGRGCKRCFGQLENGLPRVSCTNATLFCTSAAGFLVHIHVKTCCSLS